MSNWSDERRTYDRHNPSDHPNRNTCLCGPAADNPKIDRTTFQPKVASNETYQQSMFQHILFAQRNPLSLSTPGLPRFVGRVELSDEMIKIIEP